MIRKSSAVWQGPLKEGRGTLSSASGVLSDTPYTFASRFESGSETNPEELVAAAHAGCFSMALAGQLGNAGFSPESIRTAATLTMEKLEAGWTVTAIHLEVTARVPGIAAAAFRKAADDAKAGCPISRLLNAKITMAATLEAEEGRKSA